MSMDLPPIQQREFVLEPKSSNSDDYSVHLRNLMPASIDNFLHADNKQLAEIFDNAAHTTLSVLFRANTLLYAGELIRVQDWNSDNFRFQSPGEDSLLSSPIVWGLNTSIFLASYAMQGLSSHYLTASLLEAPVSEDVPVIEKDSLPTNNAKLREDVYNVALQSGIMPDKFKDPIMFGMIDTPVAFEDDPTATIYDLETVNALQKNRLTQNPLAQNLRLDFNKLVYLPEVKKQIDAIAELEDGIDEKDIGIDERTIGLNED